MKPHRSRAAAAYARQNAPSASVPTTSAVLWIARRPVNNHLAVRPPWAAVASCRRRLARCAYGTSSSWRCALAASRRETDTASPQAADRARAAVALFSTGPETEELVPQGSIVNFRPKTAVIRLPRSTVNQTHGPDVLTEATATDQRTLTGQGMGSESGAP